MRVVKQHDCGRHGMLTVKEIVALTGCAHNTICDRIRNGIKGEALVEPVLDPRARRKAVTYRDDAVRTAGRSTMALALTIARDYRDKAPTVQQLMAHYGMHRTTAYRWREAYIDIMGVE